MWFFETTIGAACARFVVKTAATDAGRSDAMTAMSSPFALMPQCTPLELKPLGAVTPPAMGVKVGRIYAGTSCSRSML